MNTFNYDLLKKLCLSFSVTSDEYDTRNILEEELKAQNITYEIDTLGNLLVGNTKDPKVAIASHIDEVGIMVKSVRNNGLLEIVYSGYIHPHTLLNSYIELKTPTGFIEGYVLSGRMFSGGLSNYELKTEDLLLDVGAKNSEEIRDMGIKIGTLGCYRKTFIERDSRIIATGIDNSVGVAIAMDLLQDEKIRKDCVFLFHRMEEWGSFGAETFEHKIFAPYSIVLDYTPASIDNDRNGEVNPEVDKGPSVVYWAKGYAIDSKLKQIIEKVGEKVPFQISFTSKSTEVEHFQNLGSLGVSLCLPARGFHGEGYVASKLDIQQTCLFAKSLINKLI